MTLSDECRKQISKILNRSKVTGGGQTDRQTDILVIPIKGFHPLIMNGKKDLIGLVSG
jgi:hypothetical protein